MSSNSSYPGMEAALFTALAARSGLAAWQVSQTFPGDALRNKAIYAGKARATLEPKTYGGNRTRRQEDYTVEVIIDCCAPGNKITDSQSDAFTAYNEIDNYVSDNPTIGGTVIHSWVSGWEDNPYMDETRGGWASMVKVTIAAMARLK